MSFLYGVVEKSTQFTKNWEAVDVFGNHGLCGLLEEGAHEKSPKCLGGNLGDFGEFSKVSGCLKNLSDGLFIFEFCK